MRTAVLFSGGKDSCLALHYALKFTDVACLITILSDNTASYMFHTPNIHLATRQARAIGIPIIIQKTKGEKEKELKDLEKAIKKAREKYKIGGIVTGALASVYQSSRIQRICNKLKLECFNPLWQKNQFELLEELTKDDFRVVITGVFALGLEKFLGREIDKRFIEEIKLVEKKYQINPAGEGGEFESLVLDAPFFKKRIEIKESHIEKDKEGGRVLTIDEINLTKKQK